LEKDSPRPGKRWSSSSASRPKKSSGFVLIVMNERVQFPLAVITTSQPYDREQGPEGRRARSRRSTRSKSHVLHVTEGRPTALRFVQRPHVRAGPVEDLVQQLVRPAPAASPLLPALRLAAEKHLSPAAS